MTLNRELFLNDPTQTAIPNDGVAQVIDPTSAKQWEVLRHELRSFVCDGEYRRGLERILNTFLDNLDQPKQPAVWVSGFYGSGKSHFVRVLEYLWRDVEFPDGAGARSLPQNLPTSVTDALKQLSTIGRREGGLWSAAGTLGAGAGVAGGVRLALLGIVFRSAGLPSRYAPARFVIWLKQEGFYDTVRAGVEAKGKTLDGELSNMYVSPVLADSLLAAYPGFANSSAEARGLLKAQYPNVEDISDDEMVATLGDVLALQSDKPGKLPCTLLIFDELQQFISEDPTRTLLVQNVVEACSSRFGSQILFVATGQASLQATSQLQKLQGRFTVRVMLSDSDVERVVREVVLQKNQTRVAELRQVLERSSGEINRHLAGTKIGPTAADANDLVADYPLLPVRRRFWERVLRSIDSAGTAGQLRTQLRIVHEAARATAHLPLGSVVPGDFIYDQQKPGMLQSGVLLRDVAQLIEEQRDTTPDGELRARLCGLILLISKLPSDGLLASGVQSNANTLADLLVDNLALGSAALRQRIPQILQALIDKGTLMLVNGEYRLQTRESMEWEAEYRRRYVGILADESRIASDRSAALRSAVDEALKGITPVQGSSKTPRKFELHFGTSAPSADTALIPVWVRDEWSVAERVVRDEAQAAGAESPVIYVFLPRRDPDAVKAAFARYAAASETLDTRAIPSSEEGKDSRSGMQSRRDSEQQQLKRSIADIIAHAKVFKGGGSEADGSLRDAVASALEGAMVRLFPKFNLADHASWGLVFTRAGQGSADPLGALGYVGDVDKHPACQEIRAYIGPVGKRGSEVQKKLTGAGYGWPKDAVDGGLLALMAAGFVRASRGGQPQKVIEIGRTQIGQTEFFSEGITLTTSQRIGLRTLCQEVGLTCKPGEEPLAVPEVLKRLSDLAAQAGGQAPLPAPPSIDHIFQLVALGGNEQLVEVFKQRDALVANFKAWEAAGSRIKERFPAWRRAQELLRHATGLEIVAELKPQLDAIAAQRALLSDPDPIPPLAARISDALRTALQSTHQRFTSVYGQTLAELEQADEWQRLSASQRQNILASNALDSLPPARYGSEQELVASLEAIPLAQWATRISALPGQAASARAAAAKLLEPTIVSVQPPRRTLKSSAELEAYLNELRGLIQPHLDAGNPVIV